MKRSRIHMGAMLAVAGIAALASVAQAAPEGRHFLLEQKVAPGTVRFISQAIELADVSKPSWVTVTRTGDFSDPRYGQFSITQIMLSQMVSNFDKRVTGQDVYIDVAHKHSDGAAAKVVKLQVQDSRLRALVEWTPFGIAAVKDRGFSYLSAEFHEDWKDNEKGAAYGCVLLGAGLTIRPVIKRLDPVQLSTDDDKERPYRLLLSPNLIKQLTETDMNKHLVALIAGLITLGFTETTAKPFTDLAEKQLALVKDDEAKCLALVETFKTAGKSAMDAVKAAGGDGKTVTITLAAPQTVDVNEAVRLAMEARDTAAAGAVTALGAKLKLLGDTIAEGDKTLTPEGVKKFADDFAPMVTAVTTDDQVKHLAGLAVKQAQALSAATKLASLGYNPASGSVHITVDTSNSIKSLQEKTDKRLGMDDEKDADRFAATGGVLLAKNKKVAEMCLAQFDALYGRELELEAKMLAAGVGNTSDVNVPKIAERTVLREALYGLVSLNLVDVATAQFAQVIMINYSFRDPTAAGVNGLRRYELQAIRKAGVLQTAEETRPIPQKLAMQVSSELKMLMDASNIDFSPVAENIRNMARIVGEDVEMINLNEIAVSADEFGAFAVSTETLTANVNGTKRIFPLANFPVVKPRKVYDLKGVQVGSTANPIVVTLGGAKTEYIQPADGSALAAGQYYVMDYNMGEVQFVTETGAAYTPANTTALTVAYSATTNVNKFDTDIGAVAVDVFYDKLLFAIGGRKSVIEDGRFYNPNMILMSGNVNNALSQAKTFQANSARVATGLAGDGSVGFVKDMAVFRPRAPGSLFGDTRIVVGERGNTRFRMVKPWSMTAMEQARDVATGAFIDAQEAFGTQWVGSHTPTQLKGAATSIVLFSTIGRIAR
jgi:hypothetical protein